MSNTEVYNNDIKPIDDFHVGFVLLFMMVRTPCIDARKIYSMLPYFLLKLKTNIFRKKLTVL